MNPVEAASPVKPGGVLDGLLKRFKPSAQTFDLELPDGTPLSFRIVSDYSELSAIRKAAESVAVSVRKGQAHASWKPFLPNRSLVGDEAADEMIAQASFLGRICLHEEMQGELPWLILAKDIGVVFMSVLELVNRYYGNAVNQAEGELIEEKKDAS